MSDRKNTIHKVPIKPHLKKFFLKSHSLTEPIKVDEDTLLGKQVLSILQDKRSLNGREMNIITEFDSDQLDDNLKLELSTTLTDRAPRIGKLIRINIYLQLGSRLKPRQGLIPTMPVKLSSSTMILTKVSTAWMAFTRYGRDSTPKIY
jgi:hypothetical protein